MEQKTNWIKIALGSVVMANIASYALHGVEYIQKTNIVAWWAVLHLVITARIGIATLRARSPSGGVFWIIMKLGSLLLFAQILIYIKKNTPHDIILIGLTPFLVVPLVGSFYWNRRESSDASRT